MENTLKKSPPASKEIKELLDAPGFNSWKWQQRNIINDVEKLLKTFPGLDASEVENIREATKGLKMGITPYYASLINPHNGLENDPLWKQVIPKVKEEYEFAYDSSTENWEVDEDMVTPIAQKKYDNRVIVRLSNVCHSYCQFCYEALRTLEKDSNKDQFQRKNWEDTLAHVKKDHSLEEIILSGGEPLMLSNKLLNNIFKDIRNVREDIIIRIHSRSLTFNPYRIDDELIDLLLKYNVKYIGLHITHPNELSDVFYEKVKMLQKASILFANIPLLKGINDDINVLKPFCIELYKNGIMPHYLYHFMPFSPGSSDFKTSISHGISLIKQMKRHVSTLAVPEFVLPHSTGKYTVPIVYEEDTLPSFDESKLEAGKSQFQFVNWQNKKINYPI